MTKNLTGQVLKSYQIQERIGAGGFGEVYKATQSSIGREVAVKIILPEYANKPEFIRRFESEAQLVARLEHPHIVPLYDYWRDPSGAYLVMRYLKGGNLRESIEQHGAWSAAKVAQMLSQMAASLAFAHANGVIHRDLKTDNILIDEAGNTYLTDFGIAKNLQEQEHHTGDAILGTPAYLSPEQIRGAVASIQSDIYALGILVFETLTAHKPFFDVTPATVLFKQLNEPLPPLNEFRQDLPEDLDPILGRATSKDPSLRYENVLAFAYAFNSVVRELEPGMPTTGVVTLDIKSVTQQEEEIFQAKNPYKGLRAFQMADSGDFFGRDTLVQDLLKRLSMTGDNNDFLAVVGPSGSGKSSVVKAGMLPQIREGILNSEKLWYSAEMVPGTHPMEELEAALLGVATTPMPSLIEQLRQDERGLVRAIKRIIPENSEFVLVIDQFEETFTMVAEEDERNHFLNTLLHAVEDERSRIKVIVTLRADFYDRPLLYAEFGNLIRRHTELVLPLTDKELEASIVGPAERIGLAMDAGLVNAIIADVFHQPGALPLLQYALTELFERREGRKMTLKAYREIAGTTGALARRAEELYAGFGKEEQAATRQMFLRLVTIGDGIDDTRRRVFQADLLSLGNQAAMQKVIDLFGKYRLLTFDHEPQTRASTIEVAHEAIIRQWQRVRDWLDENREALRLHRRLTAGADEWNQSRRDASFLARGVRLQQFEEFSGSSDIALTANERQYIELSVLAREELELAEKERKAREEALEKQAKGRLRLLAVVMTVAAFISVGFAYFAFQAQQESDRQAVLANNNAATATVAQGQALFEAENAATSAAIASENEADARGLALAANARNAASEGDSQLALSLALESERLFDVPPVEVYRTLSTMVYAAGPRYRFTSHRASVVGASFSPDGQLSVTASVDGTVRVRDNNTGEETLVLSATGIWFNDAAISPDNRLVAAAASDGKVYVWSYPEGNPVHTMMGHEGEILSIYFSPDGTQILSGGFDRTIRLWDSNTGTEIRVFEQAGAVYKALFSPDGTRILSTSADETTLNVGTDLVDRKVRLWDIETGEMLWEQTPNSGFIRAAAYSPLGESVAIAVWDSGNGGTIRIYSVETGEELDRIFTQATTPILDLAYSPDGLRIAAVAWDRVLWIFDVVRGVELNTYTGFGERLLAMDWSSQGDTILLGLGNIGDNEYKGTDRALDSSVYLWDILSRDEVFAYTEHTDWIWGIDISPDGSMIATSGGPFRMPVAVEGQPAPSIDMTVRVWDAATGETLAALAGHTNTVDAVRFHPDGQRLLSAAWDGSMILWDIANQEAIRVYHGHDAETQIYMIDFVGDGSRFISVGQDGKAILWDTESGEIIRIFEHPSTVYSLDISPDGTQVLTGTGGDNLIYLWDIESGDLVRTFAGHNSSINEARFHPTELMIVSSSWDSTIRVWNIETGEELRRFVGHNGNTRGLAISPDGTLLLSTSSDTSVRMWDWETGEELHHFEQHDDWVNEVVFSPDGLFAYSAGQDPAARVWRIDRSTAALEAFAESTRYLRPLSCDERQVYRLSACEN